MFGGSRLFSAFDAIVTEQRTYYSAGIGNYMADFLAGRMYNGYLNIQQCVIRAAYVLFQAKEHVEGCGGDSHIAVLQNDGASGKVDWTRIEAINKLLQSVDDQAGKLILEAANLNRNDSEFKEAVDSIRDGLVDMRDIQRNELKLTMDILSMGSLGGKPKPTDSFGLPISPDDDSTS